MAQLFLNDSFRRAWQGKDPFRMVQSLKGEIFRQVKSRRTLRFEFNKQSYFVKIHLGVGWYEILKNWLQGKPPILGADNEYMAIRHLERAGVETMTCVAYGHRGLNPAQRESFIITEDLVGTESLEDICHTWSETPPPPALKRALIERVATMCRLMHTSGVNHRDCYICHFLLDVKQLSIEHLDSMHLYIIDLHRAQIRDQVPTRWQIKDLAGIFFSSMDLSLTRTDLWRFISTYEDCSISKVSPQQKQRWQTVKQKAIKLYKKEFGRIPNTIL